MKPINIRNLIKNKYIFFTLTSMVILLIILACGNLNNYPLFFDDCLAQYQPILVYLKNASLAEIFKPWDWNAFLGVDYISGFSFYSTSNFLVIALVKILPASLEGYYYFIIQIICLLLLLFTSYKWLSSLFKNKISILVGITIFVFSGWNIAFFKYAFLHILWLLPLILLGVEEFLIDNKKFKFIASLILLGCFSYYFAIVFTPIIFLYTLVRYCMITEKYILKNIVLKAVSFFFFYIISLGCSAIIIYPAVVNVFGIGSRVSLSANSIFNIDIISIEEFFRFISGFFNPVNGSNNHNFLLDVDFSNTWLTYGGGPVIYSLVASLLFLPQAFYVENKKNKIIMTLVYTLFIILVCVQSLYPLLNGNWDSRWMLIIVLFNAFFTAQVIEKLDKIKLKNMIITTIVLIILYTICIGFSLKMNYLVGTTKLYIVIFNFCCFILICIMYNLTLFKFNHKKFWLSLILILECFLSSYGIFIQTDAKSLPEQTISKEEYNNLTENLNSLIRYIKKNDSGFYRIDVIGKPTYRSNDGFALDYKSFTTYLSSYNYNYEQLANGRFKGYDQWHFLENQNQWLLKNMFSSKYFIDLVDGRDAIPYGYNLYATVNGIDIYENSYHLPLGFAMDNTISLEAYQELSKFEQDRVMLGYVAVEGSSNTKYEYVDSKIKLNNEELFSSLPIDVRELNEGYLFVEELTDYYHMFPRGYELYKGKELVFGDIKLTDYPSVIKFNGETETVFVHVNSKESRGYDIAYNIYYDDMSWYEDWYSNLIDESFYNIEYTDQSIKANIDLKSDKIVFTSIGYDDGWKLKINGKPQEILYINEGLIGFNAKEGENVIELTYEPEELKIGMIISGVSIGILLVVSIYPICKKKYFKKTR